MAINIEWTNHYSENFTDEEINDPKDYRIINDFTRNEFSNLYPIDDKYNQYGEILDDIIEVEI